MKRLITFTCAVVSLAACSGISQFIYYEPQAKGWQLGSPAAGEPDYEAFTRRNGYAISVYATIVSSRLKSIGPPLLPVIPVAGKNEQSEPREPNGVSVYVRFFWKGEFTADIDFASVTLNVGSRKISAFSVYKLSDTIPAKKTRVSTQENISILQTQRSENGQFVTYQLVFPLEVGAPDKFTLEIPQNAVRANGEALPATTIRFEKKTASKYQYFP